MTRGHEEPKATASITSILFVSYALSRFDPCATPDDRTKGRDDMTDGSLPVVGQPLPDFSLAGTDGAMHNLRGLLTAPHGLVLFFFPKVDTGG